MQLALKSTADGTVSLGTRDISGSTIAGVVVVFDGIGDQPLSRFRLKLITRAGEKVFTAKGLTKTRGAYDVPTASGSVTVEW